MTAPSPAEPTGSAVVLTPKERIVLHYLNPLMEANARMIGEHILTHKLGGGEQYFSYWRSRRRET